MKIIDELTRYLLKNYSSFMTLSENMAWRYFLFIEKGHKESAEGIRNMNSPEIRELIDKGEEAFYVYVKERIINDHKSEIVFNYCPKCGELTRTPNAKQCSKCKFDWH